MSKGKLVTRLYRNLHRLITKKISHVPYIPAPPGSGIGGLARENGNPPLNSHTIMLPPTRGSSSRKTIPKEVPEDQGTVNNDGRSEEEQVDEDMQEL